MRKKKIPGKKGSYPTHYIELCSNCNGEMIKFITKDGTVIKKCRTCDLIYIPSSLMPPEFKHASEL